MGEVYTQKKLDGVEVHDFSSREVLIERLAKMSPAEREDLRQESLAMMNSAELLIHAINRLDNPQEI